MNESKPRPPGMRRSERERNISHAHLRLDVLIDGWREEYGLTDIETLQGLTSYMQSTLKYALRAERHPEAPDTPAGEDTAPQHVHSTAMPCNVMCPANPNTVRRRYE
jgi:hypothetical protein